MDSEGRYKNSDLASQMATHGLGDGTHRPEAPQRWLGCEQATQSQVLTVPWAGCGPPHTVVPVSRTEIASE